MKKLYEWRLSLRIARSLVLWLGLVGLLGSASGPALADPPTYIIKAVVTGKVRGADENILFSGTAAIESTIITAPKQPAMTEIMLDFSTMKATGETSRLSYQVENPPTIRRRLNQTGSVNVDFSYYRDGNLLAARSAEASFDLNEAGQTPSQVVIGPVRPGTGN